MTLLTNSFDRFVKRYCDISLFDMSSSLHFVKGVRHDILLSNQGEFMVCVDHLQLKKFLKQKNEKKKNVSNIVLN